MDVTVDAVSSAADKCDSVPRILFDLYTLRGWGGFFDSLRPLLGGPLGDLLRRRVDFEALPRALLAWRQLVPLLETVHRRRSTPEGGGNVRVGHAARPHAVQLLTRVRETFRHQASANGMITPVLSPHRSTTAD